MTKLRDPLPEELNTPEFNAVWECIKGWDIGLSSDIDSLKLRSYNMATGNHVVVILDALGGKKKFCRFHKTRIRMNCRILDGTCLHCTYDCSLNK